MTLAHKNAPVHWGRRQTRGRLRDSKLCTVADVWEASTRERLQKRNVMEPHGERRTALEGARGEGVKSEAGWQDWGQVWGSLYCHTENLYLA